MKCFFIKEGFMNEKAQPQNNFIVDSVLDTTTLSREKMVEIIDKCTAFKGDDDCANAYEV